MSIVPANYASASALLHGAEVHLRSAALFNDQPSEALGKYFGRQPAPGRPPRNFGQWYAALHWGGGRGADMNPQCHDAYHGLVVTLTVRLNYAPKDRQGIRLTTAGDVYDLADAIAGRNVIHGSWALIAEANKLIPGTKEYLLAQNLDPADATVNGFEEPLVLGPYGPEREEGPEWIGAEQTSDLYAIDVRFEQARRIQYQT